MGAVLGIAVIAAAILVFVPLALARQAHTALEDEKARLKALGFPITKDDVRALVEKPGENAAPLIDKMVSDFGKLGLSYPSHSKDVPVYLAKVRPVYRKFLQLKGKEVCYWPSDWETVEERKATFDTLFEVCRSVLLRAEWEANKGNFEASIEILDDVDRLAALVGNRPFALSQLMAYRLSMRVARSYATMAGFAEDNGAVEALIAAAQKRPALAEPRLSWLTEPAFLLAVLDDPDIDKDNLERLREGDLPDSEVRVAINIPAIRKQVLRELIAVPRRAYESFPEETDWRAEYEAFAHSYAELKSGASQTHRVAVKLSVDENRMARTYASAVAVQNSLLTALRFAAGEEGMRREQDPFTGKELALKIGGGRVQVYSVGFDGVDNGNGKGDVGVTIRLNGK
jgi:hypothetical protein